MVLLCHYIVSGFTGEILDAVVCGFLVVMLVLVMLEGTGVWGCLVLGDCDWAG